MTPESLLFTVIAAVGGYLLRHVNLFGHVPLLPGVPAAPTTSRPVLTALEQYLLGLLHQATAGTTPTATPTQPPAAQTGITVPR